MAQQLQQPQAQSYQFQPQFAQGQAMQPAAQGRYEQTLAPEVQNAVASLDKLENVLEWAKARCAQRGNAGAVRICDDIEDLAHLEHKLLLRGSPFAQSVGQTIQQSIQDGLQELQQHGADPEMQQSVEQAQHAVAALQQGLARFQPATGGQPARQFGQQATQQGIQSW